MAHFRTCPVRWLPVAAVAVLAAAAPAEAGRLAPVAVAAAPAPATVAAAAASARPARSGAAGKGDAGGAAASGAAAGGVAAGGAVAGGTAAVRSDGPRCQGAPQRLQLQPGKSTLLQLPARVASRSIGHPGVAQALLVAPDTLYVAGVAVGSTNMIVQLAGGRCSVYDVEVGIDAAGLQAALAQLLPDEKGIRVSAAADSLVLSGVVSDGPTLAHVMELAQAFVRRPSPPLPGGASHGNGGSGAESTAASGGGHAVAAQPGAQGGQGGQWPRVICLATVAAPQQVMLEVKVAEVSKTLLDKLEAGVMLQLGGGWAATVLSNFLTGVARGSVEVSRGSGKRVTLEAERQDALVRILAEPTVMAMSGQEGSFLAGGKILIPVAQDDRRITLEEKEFGVGLRFTPTVLSGGRINLKVAPEVSELSREGVGIRAGGISGTAVLPLVTTRRASTTVQLYDGQSFAIGGLVRNNQNTSVKGVPFLGEIPILGALFRSTDFQQERTELLFVITPRLVQPLPPGQALPTGDMTPPSRGHLFLGGDPVGGKP